MDETPDSTATITVWRDEQAITVALALTEEGWTVMDALDEDGGDVELTETETASVISRAEAGEDETGR